MSYLKHIPRYLFIYIFSRKQMKMFIFYRNGVGTVPYVVIIKYS